MNDVFSPNPEAPVLLIGAASQDIVGRLRYDLNSGTSNPAHIRSSFGGAARNVAENLVRLGQPATLLTVVGEDSIGDKLIEQVEAVGVDTSYALRTSERPTSSYLAVVDLKGKLQYALDDMRAISALTPAYLEENAQLFDEASLLFVDANLSKETLRKAITLAHRAGIPICADPTSTVLASRFKTHLPRLSLFTPNMAEAEILCGCFPFLSGLQRGLESAKSLVGLGVDLAIISLAELGVCYATSETSGQVPAIRTHIVDPTGGGDALTAAVIFALLNEIPLDDAMRLGVSAASLTLRYQGAVVPDLSLQKLYDQW
jgi:pseudouridine kinase